MSHTFVKIWILILGMMSPSFAMAKDGYPPNPDLDILHYRFHICLNDSTDCIHGLAEITCKLNPKLDFLVLDLQELNSAGKGMQIRQIRHKDLNLRFLHENNHVTIELPYRLRMSGTVSFSIEYQGIPENGLIISKNKFGQRTFFGDNWPDRAHQWLPCVDHPSDKATVDFIVTAPEHYQVVSLGRQTDNHLEVTANGEHNRVTCWEEHVPVATKVMVIGAADFVFQTVGISRGIPVQSWVYAPDSTRGFADFKPAVEILDFFQDLIGPYSYEKLANVQSKTMFGGMENSGCIFYHETSVTGQDKIRCLLAHEIAHQWFGDAVTENDWKNIWLSEGFATYLEACYSDSMIPDRKMSSTMAKSRESVIRYYSKKQTPLIDTTFQQKIELLNANSYQKGAWVLHMLRKEVGDPIFWKGMRQFYSTYRDKNAASTDFKSIMEAAAGRDLDDFFKQWLEYPGFPIIRCNWTSSDDHQKITLEINQTQGSYIFKFDLPIDLVGNQSSDDTSTTLKHRYVNIPVTEQHTLVTLPIDFPVQEIRLDPKNQLLYQEQKPDI